MSAEYVYSLESLPLSPLWEHVSSNIWKNGLYSYDWGPANSVELVMTSTLCPSKALSTVKKDTMLVFPYPVLIWQSLPLSFSLLSKISTEYRLISRISNFYSLNKQ